MKNILFVLVILMAQPGWGASKEVYCGHIAGPNQYGDLLLSINGYRYPLSFLREEDANDLKKDVGRLRCVYGEVAAGFEADYVIVVDKQVYRLRGTIAGKNQYGDILLNEEGGFGKIPLSFLSESMAERFRNYPIGSYHSVYGDIVQGVEAVYFQVIKEVR